MKINLKSGKKYSICTCGLSKCIPFCDNSHREFNRSNGTEFKSLKIISKNDNIIEVSSSRWESI